MHTNILYGANEWEKRHRYKGKNPFKRLWYLLFPETPDMRIPFPGECMNKRLRPPITKRMENEN